MTSKIFFLCLVSLISITSAFKPRIIGGNDADIKHFPYQASLRVKNRHFCGGTIINEKHILSAAHCFLVEPINDHIFQHHANIRVVTGTSYTSKEPGHVHRVSKLAIHPDWTGTEESFFANDIAILTLSDPIIFDDKQQKVDLPSQNVVSGTNAYLTGWGCTSPEKRTNNAFQLQKLKMTLLSYTDCKADLFISESQLCAYQVHKSGYGSCRGDSGGPLVVNNQLVGIISWAEEGGGGISGLPEVYTNVYFYRAFIESTMKKY